MLQLMVMMLTYIGDEMNSSFLPVQSSKSFQVVPSSLGSGFHEFKLSGLVSGTVNSTSVSMTKNQPGCCAVHTNDSMVRSVGLGLGETQQRRKFPEQLIVRLWAVVHD